MASYGSFQHCACENCTAFFFVKCLADVKLNEINLLATRLIAIIIFIVTSTGSLIKSVQLLFVGRRFRKF